MSEQSASNRPFSTEDARKALLIRSYMLKIENKLIALLQTEGFGDAIAQVRQLLAKLDELQKQQNAAQPCRCYEDYECCNGICEVWCS